MGSNKDELGFVYRQGQEKFLLFKQAHNLASINSAHIRLDKVTGY
jgi:hypothetical protein